MADLATAFVPHYDEWEREQEVSGSHVLIF